MAFNKQRRTKGVQPSSQPNSAYDTPNCNLGQRDIAASCTPLVNLECQATACSFSSPQLYLLPYIIPTHVLSPTLKHTLSPLRLVHNTQITCLKYSPGLREAGALPAVAEAATLLEALENRQTAMAHRQPSTHQLRQANWQSLRSAIKPSFPC